MVHWSQWGACVFFVSEISGVLQSSVISVRSVCANFDCVNWLSQDVLDPEHSFVTPSYSMQLKVIAPKVDLNVGRRRHSRLRWAEDPGVFDWSAQGNLNKLQLNGCSWNLNLPTNAICMRRPVAPLPRKPLFCTARINCRCLIETDE